MNKPFYIDHNSILSISNKKSPIQCLLNAFSCSRHKAKIRHLYEKLRVSSPEGLRRTF